jgi:hypothetical protein
VLDGDTQAREAALAEAEALLRGCITAHPQCPMAYNNLALVLVARGELPASAPGVDVGAGGRPGTAGLYAEADAALGEARKLARPGAEQRQLVEQNRALLERLRRDRNPV